jgi:hypothetical protein
VGQGSSTLINVNALPISAMFVENLIIPFWGCFGSVVSLRAAFSAVESKRTWPKPRYHLRLAGGQPRGLRLRLAYCIRRRVRAFARLSAPGLDARHRPPLKRRWYCSFGYAARDRQLLLLYPTALEFLALTAVWAAPSDYESDSRLPLLQRFRRRPNLPQSALSARRW